MVSGGWGSSSPSSAVLPGTVEEHDRYYEEIDQCCAGFLAELALRDPTLADNDLGSLWAAAITEYPS